MKTVMETERIPFLQKNEISYSKWFPETIFNDPHIVKWNVHIRVFEKLNTILLAKPSLKMNLEKPSIRWTYAGNISDKSSTTHGHVKTSFQCS